MSSTLLYRLPGGPRMGGSGSFAVDGLIGKRVDTRTRSSIDAPVCCRRHYLEDTPSEFVHAAFPSRFLTRAILNATNGLFKVAGGVYQVRGFSVANMAIVEGRPQLDDPIRPSHTGSPGRILNVCFQTPNTSVMYSDSNPSRHCGVRFQAFGIARESGHQEDRELLGHTRAFSADLGPVLA